MKIAPCEEATGFAVLSPIVFVLFGVFYIEIGTPSAIQDTHLLAVKAVTIVVCIMSEALMIGPMIYFGRTITLDPEGCCFSFRSFEKKFRWEELDVQYYENVHKYRTGHEIAGPGILINVKGRKYNPKQAAMEYCYLFHPMTSVFLSFRVPWDDLDPWKRSPMIRGYAIKREELLAALRSFGQCPEVPES